MSEELKQCPLCGDKLQIVHRNGSKYVRCIKSACVFESSRHGDHISDDELIKRCNRRPEEERLKQENEALFRHIARLTAQLKAMEDAYAEMFKKNVPERIMVIK